MRTNTKSPSDAGAVMQSAGELNSFNINRYPDRIVLSATAENYISALAEDLILGTVELWQLSPALSQFYWFAYDAGRVSRQPEVDNHSWDADRYYREMCRRPGVPFENPNQPTYAQLQKIRADIYGGSK